MAHRIEPFIQGMSNAAEKVLYSATGTLSGIAGSKTSRDLQDLYIRDKRIKFEKPYTNLNKWQKQYNIRYVWKKRFKGDFLVESSNTQRETLHPEEPYYRNSGSSGGYSTRKGTRRTKFFGRANKNRKQYQGCICRNVGKNRRYRTRYRSSYSR